MNLTVGFFDILNLTVGFFDRRKNSEINIIDHGNPTVTLYICPPNSHSDTILSFFKCV
jgi:hypothetical protein